MPRHHWHAVSLALVLLFALACGSDRAGGPSSGAAVASVVITPDPAVVAVGGNAVMTATARDSAGVVIKGVGITWSLTDTLRAHVSSSGTLTGISGGEDTVFAAVGTVHGTAPISVDLPGHSVTRSALGLGGIGCVLSPTGAASCWGNGLAAPLGNGTTKSSATPVPVSGGHTFSAIAVGAWSTCALTATGAAWCWGNGFGGELGDGSDTSATEPAAVSGGPYFFIAVGLGNACAIAAGGRAYCWGDDEYGTFGNGTSSSAPAPTPTPVSGGLNFASISIGQDIACGVTAAGAGYCWGTNTLGSLGNGTRTSSLVPVQVTGGLTWRTILVAESVACGLTTSGSAYCWGLGSQTTGSGDYTRPGLISPSLVFASIALGGDQACGVTASGEGYCWGGNVYGERGTGGSIASVGTPAPVTGGLTFTEIVGGAWSTCGRTTSGAIYCWGQEFGASPFKTTPSPVELVGAGST